MTEHGCASTPLLCVWWPTTSLMLLYVTGAPTAQSPHLRITMLWVEKKHCLYGDPTAFYTIAVWVITWLELVPKTTGTHRAQDLVIISHAGTRVRCNKPGNNQSSTIYPNHQHQARSCKPPFTISISIQSPSSHIGSNLLLTPCLVSSVLHLCFHPIQQS